MAKKRGTRFPLLIYTNIWRRWGRKGLALSIVSLLLLVFGKTLFGPTLWRYLALFPVLAGIIIYSYSLACRKMAYVQCFPTYLRIRTPIYPLVISYRRIRGTQAVQLKQIFSPKTAKAARRTWPVQYWTQTAVVIEIKEYPVSTQWLRLWFDRYLFSPQTKGFVLLVEEWMPFSQQLDGLVATYRSRRSRS